MMQWMRSTSRTERVLLSIGRSSTLHFSKTSNKISTQSEGALKRAKEDYHSCLVRRGKYAYVQLSTVRNTSDTFRSCRSSFDIIPLSLAAPGIIILHRHPFSAQDGGSFCSLFGASRCSTLSIKLLFCVPPEPCFSAASCAPAADEGPSKCFSSSS